MLAFLFINILLGFEDAGIAPDGGITKKNCHIVAHLGLEPQRLSGLQLNECLKNGRWVNKLDIFEQQAYLLDIGGILIVTLQFKAGFIEDTLIVKDLGRGCWSGSGICSGCKPALLKN